jgi:hypothetical protein
MFSNTDSLMVSNSGARFTDGGGTILYGFDPPGSENGSKNCGSRDGLSPRLARLELRRFWLIVRSGFLRRHRTR